MRSPVGPLMVTPQSGRVVRSAARDRGHDFELVAVRERSAEVTPGHELAVHEELDEAVDAPLRVDHLRPKARVRALERVEALAQRGAGDVHPPDAVRRALV